MAQPASYRAIGIALAFFGAAFFSLKGITTKFIYVYRADPVTLIALRMLFSLPFFLVAAGWSNRGTSQSRFSRRDLLALVVLGLLGYYLASLLDFIGLLYVPASIERLTLFLYPTVVLLLSAVFLRAAVRGIDIAAVVLSYAGIALVLLHGSSAAGTHMALGSAFVFASAIVYAIYLVAGTQTIRRVGSVRFVAYASTVASIACVLHFLALRPIEALLLPPAAYGWFVVLAIVNTVLPMFMTAEALKRIGATQVAIIGAIGPLTTMAADWILLNDGLSATQILGAALVLAGVLLVTLKPAN